MEVKQTSSHMAGREALEKEAGCPKRTWGLASIRRKWGGVSGLGLMDSFKNSLPALPTGMPSLNSRGKCWPDTCGPRYSEV